MAQAIAKALLEATDFLMFANCQTSILAQY